MKISIFLYSIFVLTLISCNENKKTEEINNVETNNITIDSTINIVTEQDYLKTRDKYIKYYDSLSNNPNQDWDKLYDKSSISLKELEKMLKEVLKNDENENLIKKGKINLENLIPEMGFGMLDGIFISDGSPNFNKTLITSYNLFNEYFKKEKIESIENLNYKQLDLIFGSLMGDAASSIMYYEKMNLDKYDYVYFGIGKFYQEYAAFTPDMLFILIKKNNYIYIIEKELVTQIKENENCTKLYNINEIEIIKDYELNKNTDSKAINKLHEMQEKSFNSYCECYQKDFKSNSQYNDFIKEVDNTILEFEKLINK